VKHASISREAEADIDRIAAYTTDAWGGFKRTATWGNWKILFSFWPIIPPWADAAMPSRQICIGLKWENM
jgi:hypothetical protein